MYWYTTDVSPGEVRTTPLSGGTPKVVPTGIIASGYANSRVQLIPFGNDLYYQRAEGTSFINGVYRWTPGDTGPGTQVVIRDNVAEFAVDANYVYFIVLNQNAIYRVPLSGGAEQQIANVGGQRILHQDADSLYVWRTTGSSTSSLVRIVK